MSVTGTLARGGREGMLGPTVSLTPGSLGMVQGAAARALHVELHTQQRRLRHLRSIAARNIVNKNGYHLLDTYFTLHLCDEKKIYKEFYKSEMVRDSLNPTWRSLDFGLMPDRLDTSVSCFVVRIWGGKKEAFRLLIEWKVNLDGLKYLGPQIHACNPNEIIFGLNDGFYGASFVSKNNSDCQGNSHLQVDQSAVRNSYGVFSLLRLHRAQCAIKQTQVTVQKIGREIEEKLRLTSSSNKLKKESECLRLKILVLQDELKRQNKALVREVELLNKEQKALNERRNSFNIEKDKLQSQSDSLNELRKECTAKRELFLKTNAQLTIRCRQLLSELSYIYPIDVQDQKDYFICGVKLPNSEDFQAKDDGSIAAALGYTAHLVSMISFFLQVPLRYPILHKGSRSAIKDNINDRLTEKEREFPLYPKGGEKLQFDYGVYLLNKNIAQLRYQHSLGTPDLRQTLPNLKSFMEHGLMVRCDRHQMSSAIPVPRRPQGSTFGSHDIGFSSRTPTPEKAPRRRANSENEKMQYKTHSPSFKSASAQPVAILASGNEVESHIASSLDADMDISKESIRKKDFSESPNSDGLITDLTDSGDQNHSEHLSESCSAINGTLLQKEHMEFPSVDNQCDLHSSQSNDLRCTLEQAEEIVGTEASDFTSPQQLEEFNCIPVDHAVAVECDDQVLGEFEEFSRRIYALNENMSSFRRPRKSSEK
ncbi:UV radiation resistance-associated gene protein [Bombina bombina]|uniref:UV radiation resistance-associated gene protein n=1 Tax=Bombina bombina TaxID=8345 RepID=UPI00235B0C82|nr:UV radiation resistance-associated gene protein [Bombina bombina]